MPDLIGIGIVLLFLGLLAWVLVPKGSIKSKDKANALDRYLIDDILDKEAGKIRKLSPGGRAELISRINKVEAK
jgi:hypothetical protein